MERWRQSLTEAGCRVTGPRQAVAQVLAHSEVPLSPHEILNRAVLTHPPLGLVTVYRTLDLFESLALARRIYLADGCRRYVGASPGHQHSLVCRKCGKTVEFVGSEDLSELMARLEDKTGFEIDGHLLQLDGLCPDCATAEA